jgi:hypothetical protein
VHSCSRAERIRHSALTADRMHKTQMWENTTKTVLDVLRKNNLQENVSEISSIIKNLLLCVEPSF